MKAPAWIETVKFDAQGLVPAVVQDAGDGAVLMFAFMTKETLLETVRTRRGVYWSRSRGKPWRKGEESGRTQEVVSVDLDCDRDAVLVRVRQAGDAACHTGRRTCFHSRVTEGDEVQLLGEPLFDPAKVYKKNQ